MKSVTYKEAIASVGRSLGQQAHRYANACTGSDGHCNVNYNTPALLLSNVFDTNVMRVKVDLQDAARQLGDT